MRQLQLLARNGQERLIELVRSARGGLLIASPFVGREGTQLVATNLSDSLRESGSIVFLTDLSPLNICQGVTDPDAILGICGITAQISIRYLPKLHAKVYVADSDVAIVSSANLTIGGLRRNREYGVELSSRNAVRRVRRDMTDYANLGASVTVDDLIAYCRAAAELREDYERRRRTESASLMRRFQDRFREVEDRLIRLRLGGGATHTVFAQTIEYLLRRHGPLTTVEMHRLISAIHPDLCDDTVDRVIDGKHFGKKWKHAARTAQQQLKKKGVIDLDGDQWRLR